MSEKRYHVYISTSLNDDVKTERLKLQNALLNMGVFPWEFTERRTSLNTAQARRQIDDCDYVVFLLGAKYGDLSASGISYMHLDFLYALNKQKTILSFIDAAPESRPESERESQPDILRKFHAFREQLKSDSESCTSYNSYLDLERAVRSDFAKIVKEKPALGWVRPKNNDVFVSEVQRLRQKVTELEQRLVQTKNQAVLTQLPENITTESQTVFIHYRTHAYQDGNFKDLHLQHEMTWLQLLQILAPHFKQNAAEITFLQALNEYLTHIALADAQVELPRAHAVARTQIDVRCLQQIKMQMRVNGWIVPQSEPSSPRVYWQLTTEAEKLLARHRTNDLKA